MVEPTHNGHANGAGHELQGAERRRFSRVPFIEIAKLMQGDHLWLVDVLDISLKGALLTRPAAWSFDPEQSCVLQLILGRDDAVVTMRGRQAYAHGHRLGLHCEEIDIDSVSLLTGILEANTGDPSLVRRELRELAGLND
jgi:hypothetical protein